MGEDTILYLQHLQLFQMDFFFTLRLKFANFVHNAFKLPLKIEIQTIKLSCQETRAKHVRDPMKVSRHEWTHKYNLSNSTKIVHIRNVC